MRGKLFGVGVGPGDPELLTLKAVRVLRQADVVAVPDKGAGDRAALAIVRDLVEGKELLSCATPMVRDPGALEAAHDKAADDICALLDRGKTVAFITLGDPCVYSTYFYIHTRVLARGYEAELVSGVPSFCAAAARLNVSLCQGAERLLIVPACHGVDDCLDIPANQVYMKAGRGLMELKTALEARGTLDRASAAANCGMENERLWPRLSDVEEAPGYLSLVLVREGEQP